MMSFSMFPTTRIQKFFLDYGKEVDCETGFFSNGYHLDLTFSGLLSCETRFVTIIIF